MCKFTEGRENIIKIYKPKRRKINTIYEATKKREDKILIPYKEAPKEVKKKVREIRKRWLSYHSFWKRPFSFQLKKVFLRLDGTQPTKKDIYFMWTILYNKSSKHRNSTTFAVKMINLK